MLALLLLSNQATPSVPRDDGIGEVRNPDPPPRLVAKWRNREWIAFLSSGSSPILVTNFDEDTPFWRHLYLRDARSGKVLSTLRSSGKSNLRGDLAVSPDGKYIAAASLDDVPGGAPSVGRVYVWEVATAREVCILPGHRMDWPRLAFSPDSRTLATGEVDKHLIKLWSIPSGKCFRTIVAPSDGVNTVAFTLDGRHLVSSGYDGVLREWDVASGKRIRTHRDGEFALHGIEMCLSDDKIAIVEGHKTEGRKAKDRVFCLWDLSRGRRLAVLREPVESIGWRSVFNRNGRWLATAWCQNVTIWDVSRRKVLHKLPHEGRVESVTFSPDGRWLAVSGMNDDEKGFLSLWDMCPE